MDNNNSGIPNVSDIKFDDTPAESFDSLYGGSSQQYVNNVSMNQVSNMTPNPGMASSVEQVPNMAPNPGVVSSMNQVPNMTPNPGMASSVEQVPNMTPNPGVASSMEQVPNMTPNPGVVSSMNQVPNMAPNPRVAPSMEQVPNMTPNSGTVIQPSVEDLSDVEIDEERMQSIEEQLSKTSQYNPADFQQEKIVIQTDDQYEKNKSGLTFLIVLFAILILAIIFLPQITKFIK